MPKSAPQEPRWQQSVRLFFTVLFHELPGLVLVNLVFLCSCLPVFTLGPALSALGRVTDDALRGRCPHPVRTYWACFRARPAAALPLGLAYLLLLAVFCLGLWLYAELMFQSWLFLPLVCLSLLALLALTGVGLHFFPALARSDAPAGALLREAGRTALVRLPATLTAAIFSLALPAALVLTFPVSLPLALTLGASAPSLISSLARTPPSGLS